MPDDNTITITSHPSRHSREHFFIEGEGLVGDPQTAPATAPVDDAPDRARAAAAAAEFRFSRMGPRGTRMPEAILRKVAAAMTTGDTGGNGNIPAGYTYLGQFVDHDLTFDHTTVALGDSVSPADLLQGRSPALDLDSLYGVRSLRPGLGGVLPGRPAPQDRPDREGRAGSAEGAPGVRPGPRRRRLRRATRGGR